MTREGRLGFWLAVVAAGGGLLYVLSEVLMPFVAGMLVAYFLDPVADKLEEKGCSRTVATSLITAAFFIVAVALLLLLIPLLQGQASDFASRVPKYLGALREHAGPLLEWLTEGLAGEDGGLSDAAGGYAGQVLTWAGAVLQKIWSGGMALLNVLSLALITPLVAFYLLRDWDRIVARIDALLPRDQAPVVRQQVAEIDRTMAGFVRGQATVCLILGTFYGVGLTIVGLDFGLLVGLGTGLISFIPYFGMLVGLAVGFGIAVVQFSGWVPIALVAAVFAVGQLIEGNFLTPKLVGEKVGLHPVWIIFALLAGGALFGFTGVLLSVPVAAAIGVLVRFAVGRYLGSSLYQGDGDPEA